MEKNKRNWIIGLCIALIAVILIAAFFMGRGDKSDAQKQSPSESTAKNTQETENQSISSLSNIQEHNEEHKNSDINHALNGDDALGKYLTEQDAIMMGMMDEMVIREHSGNASIDFLKGMIPHHEAAVEMSEAYLKYGGENQELETMAKDIITAQKEELKQMNDLLKQFEEDGKQDQKKEDEYLKKYSEMFSEDSMSHHMNPEDVDSIDQAFAESMIMHHQMAVDMARDILEYTEYDEIRDLAQSIADTQEKEIDQMKKQLQ